VFVIDFFKDQFLLNKDVVNNIKKKEDDSKLAFGCRFVWPMLVLKVKLKGTFPIF
jgi:hypothetical protein